MDTIQDINRPTALRQDPPQRPQASLQAAPAAPASYVFMLLPGMGTTEALGISQQGTVVGLEDGVAKIWKRTSTGYADPQPLPLPAGVTGVSHALSISNNGRHIAGGESKAVYWPVSEAGDAGAPVLLHRDFFASVSMARAVNNEGKVTGEAAFPNAMARTTTLWTISAPPPGVENLGVLDNGGDSSGGWGINDQGDVVGRGNILGGKFQRGGHWKGKTDTELPPLPRHDTSAAKAINDDGVIVGSSSQAGTTHATRWRMKNGKLVPCSGLRALPGTLQSTANDVNVDGVVVGDCGGQAVLWAGQIPIALEGICAGLPVGWRLKSATAINDEGWIIGVALQEAGGASRAFVLQAL